MKTRNHTSTIVLLVMLISAALLYVTFAVAEDASENWCFDPEHWGDGRCADEDPWIRNWYYTCGWYRAAIDRGELTLLQIPEMCRRPLPDLVSTAEPTQEVTPEPTQEVTPEPTQEVTPEPTQEVTPEPTQEVTPEPTQEVTPEPGAVTASINFCVYTTTTPITFVAGTWAQLNVGGVPTDTTRIVFTFTEGSTTRTGTFGADSYPFFNIEFAGADLDTLTNGIIQTYNAGNTLTSQGTIGNATCT